MSKKSKIFYISLSLLIFSLFNKYVSDLIIKNSFEIEDNPIFNIVYVENIGAAFNIFEGYKIFLITFSIFAILGILFYTYKHIDKLTTFCLFFVALLVSGIFNNMYERILFGYVRDFIKLNFIDFPVFNISDLCINIGVAGVIYSIFKLNYYNKQS